MHEISCQNKNDQRDIYEFMSYESELVAHTWSVEGTYALNSHKWKMNVTSLFVKKTYATVAWLLPLMSLW